jgi:hypothetical protein
MVSFTHRPPWTGLEPNDFNKTLWRLGEAGWELVSSGSSPAESFADQARSLFFKRRLAPGDGAGPEEGPRMTTTVAA